MKQSNFQTFSKSLVTCIKGLICWSQKLKVAFHQFLLIGLLEKKQVLSSGINLTFMVAMVTKMADKIGLK